MASAADHTAAIAGLTINGSNADLGRSRNGASSEASSQPRSGSAAGPGAVAVARTGTVSISQLLKRLTTAESAHRVSAEEVAAALSLMFTGSLSPVQFAVLLWALHTTGLDHQPSVLAASAASMREAATRVDADTLRQVVKAKNRAEGAYEGGLCDMVGTGGDGHNTFNISTTASIISSAILMVAKHGNNSSTSLSGSADLIQHAPDGPVIAATTASNLAAIYTRSNYAFLYAREWHPGMKNGASVRKEIPVRTIFNLLGPLANPVHDSGCIEARILGVARKDIGLNFAEALRLSGAYKAMVICGDEDLDELSCAGPTHCWYLTPRDGPATPSALAPTDEDAYYGPNILSRRSSDERLSISSAVAAIRISKFTLTPEDFGLQRHSLATVHGGKGPAANAEILMQILRNQRPADDPVLDFVLLNTAALITISGVTEADESNMGPGDDGKVIDERGPGGLRWKEGLRRARWCVASGAALREWEAFAQATRAVSVDA